MLKKILFVIIVLAYTVSQAQVRDSINTINKITPYAVKPFYPVTATDKLKRLSKRHPYITFWKELNRIGLDLSEVAFVNWNAGGANSVAGLLNVDVKRIYERKNLRWNNEFIARYGINKQKDQEVRKTDDHLEINSTFGYRKDTISNWYSSAKMNFSTQFSNGYNYPDRSNKISTIMAPAYLFLGVGSEYNNEDLHLNVYASPLTMRSTFVLDQDLANDGAFGVEPAVYDEEGNLISEGENVRTELGILLTNEYNTQLFENIGLSNKLSLYTDYINKFGNIDVNWELNFNFKVNQYVLAKLGSHLKYDDDIKVQEENAEGELVDAGPKIQWKQQLGIGVIVEL
ncbi:DUF3078 domain-containing protein [Mesonia sp.]|uniref:DUF3078 domain-containing protein n=1 Tax=Mesonia sp. TaxID=1960830 RepID=UPI001779FB71|nr:DUF3078 domain-containing protein [Mesonia sp.]HIB38623.1 DUF3078 domain-containing protein [Mesonia sp.]HIO26118.1 DUF3078 domain-containing protein [Flavobacteriaceae bacterium]